MKLHLFNPENDLALADGSANYFAPSAAMYIAHDLATLPLWFAQPCDTVLLPGEQHCSYARTMAKDFDIAKVYSNTLQKQVTEIGPWGWSPQIHRRLQSMGFSAGILPSPGEVDTIRRISNRRSSIEIVNALQKRGIETPHVPLYFTEPADVAAFINSRPKCVIKAPWSGSGKGIAWGIGRVEPPMEHFYTGVMRRQGGIICEEFFDIDTEFAMEFKAAADGVEFAGYSLFNSVKGSYSGNILAGDEEIEKILTTRIPAEQLHATRDALTEVLGTMLTGSGYRGYLGIDMMVYNCNGTLRLNPCMELNLRMNMGMAARRIFDCHVHPRSRGEFHVAFFKSPGQALEMHQRNTLHHPRCMENRRIKSGYINFSPVTAESRYVAYAIVAEATSNGGYPIAGSVGFSYSQNRCYALIIPE